MPVVLPCTPRSILHVTAGDCHAQSRGRFATFSFPPCAIVHEPFPAKTNVCGFVQAQLVKRRGRAMLRWRCESAPEPDTSSQKLALEESGIGDKNMIGSGTGDKSSINSETTSFMEGPTKEVNRMVALASAVSAIGLFLFTRIGFSGVTLGELAASATSYEEALSNGKPTVLEFYADWCEVCREMAPDVYKVEQQYKDLVNFVMLNVDNSKWEEELDEFGVEGIPHFTFLDMGGNEEGNIVGRLPKKYLEENVLALAKGATTVPHTQLVGKFSSAESRQTTKVAEPRSHGN